MKYMEKSSCLSKCIITFNGYGMFKYPQYLKHIILENAEIINFEEDSMKNKETYLYVKNCNDSVIKKLESTYFLNTDDMSNVLDIVLKTKKKYNIIGILNLHEKYVKHAANLAQFLKLPNVGVIAMDCCTNKHKQRLLFSDISPKFKLAVREDIDFEFDYPVVIKPIDKHSSINVVKCSTSEELQKLLIDYSESLFLIEEYIEGNEYSIESIVKEGKILFTGITEKMTNEHTGRHFVEIGHTISDLVDISLNLILKSFNQTIIDRLMFESGVVHLEVKLNSNGELYLIEVAARNPGDSIMALYNIAYGFSFEKAILDVLTGQKTSCFSPISRSAREMFINLTDESISELISIYPEVKITKLWDHDIRKSEFHVNRNLQEEIHEITLFKMNNEELKQVKNSYDRKSSVIISAPNLDLLNALTLKIQNKLNERIF